LATLSELQRALNANLAGRGQRLYPVIDASNRVLGVVTRGDLQQFHNETTDGERDHVCLSDILKAEPLVAHPDEPLADRCKPHGREFSNAVPGAGAWTGESPRGNDRTSGLVEGTGAICGARADQGARAAIAPAGYVAGTQE
jgi:hypothetical protein